MSRPPDTLPLERPAAGFAAECWPVVLSTLVFGALWLREAVRSEGFLEADACTHYLFARFAFDEPFRFVDIWGRPIKTLLYAVPAYVGGRTGVRCMSLALAVACAMIALLIARRAGVRRGSLAFVLTLASPLVFLHSFSELTELPFAVLLGVTFLLYITRHPHATALLAGFLPLARPEGFGFLALAAGLLAWRWLGHARARPLGFTPLLLLPVGLLLWSYLGWEAYGRAGAMPTWLIRNWPYAGESVYRPGPALHFVALLPAVTSPALFPALFPGIVRSLSAGVAPEALRVRRLALGVAGFVLVGHSLLYATGKMASNGELRYLLVCAPFWGVLLAVGWEWLFERLGRSGAEAVRFAGYAALVPLALDAQVYRVLPLRFDTAWQTTRFVAHWADGYGRSIGRPALMAAHPGVYYFLDRSPNDPTLSRDFVRANLLHPPPGTVLLFDPVYARFNASRDRRIDSLDEIRAAGWRELPYFRIGGWHVFVSPDGLRR